MENNCSIPVQEPRSSNLTFISAASLQDHVIKHVLKAPEERWISVFDPETVARARELFWEDGPLSQSDDFKHLTALYARLAAKTMFHCCSRGICHIHQLEDVVTIESKTVKLVKRFQIIQAYSEEKKAVVIASLQIEQDPSQTSNSQHEEGKTPPADYVILTMFRPEKKLLKKQSFMSWFNDRIERVNPKRPNETLLADHR